MIAIYTNDTFKLLNWSFTVIRKRIRGVNKSATRVCVCIKTSYCSYYNTKFEIPLYYFYMRVFLYVDRFCFCPFKISKNQWPAAKPK
jgi:hypothetical protein